MNESKIPCGQMFLQFPAPVVDGELPMPKVWVKVSDIFLVLYGIKCSVFVDNRALALFSMNAIEYINQADKWYITDACYEKSVADKKFIPISDLNEVDELCEQAGYPRYEIDLP